MSEFKGTKGNWIINETGYQILNENKDPLCDVWNFNKPTEEYNANAKLIACAPELLEMLKNLLSMYINTDKPSIRITLEAQELIKKATQ